LCNQRLYLSLSLPLASLCSCSSLACSRLPLSCLFLSCLFLRCLFLCCLLLCWRALGSLHHKKHIKQNGSPACTRWNTPRACLKHSLDSHHMCTSALLTPPVVERNTTSYTEQVNQGILVTHNLTSMQYWQYKSTSSTMLPI